MVSSKVILSAVFIFITMFSAQAQKPAAREWSIADYFKNLPEKYITASGDFMKPSAKTLVVDEKNGYAAAYMAFPPRPETDDEKFPTFQMALFKSQTKPPLLVVVNRQNDHVCDNYETFFLRRVGSGWTEVKSEVLPPMNLKIFWDKPQSAERLLKIVGKNSVSYHFEPPRQGTRMKVSLEICDYVAYIAEDTPPEKADELIKLIESAKTIHLDWDKQNGKFKLAK